MQEISTRSPGRTLRTSPPISTTVPTASWPRMRPGVTSGTSPLMMCRSVPQMVTASTRTTASAASLMPGSGTSCQEVCPGPWKTSAFMTSPSLPLWSGIGHRQPDLVEAGAHGPDGPRAGPVGHMPRRGRCPHHPGPAPASYRYQDGFWVIAVPTPFAAQAGTPILPVRRVHLPTPVHPQCPNHERTATRDGRAPPAPADGRGPLCAAVRPGHIECRSVVRPGSPGSRRRFGGARA